VPSRTVLLAVYQTQTLAMVFTAAQTTAFYTDADQMAVPALTRAQLIVEGLDAIDDLNEFDDDSLKQLFDNLKKPGGTIPDPNPGAGPGATISTPAFVLGAKSQQRLKTAMHAARYYQTVGRELTTANMRWDPVLKNFQESWKALADRKDEDEPDVPKITKALPIMKWTEAMRDHLQRVVGCRMIPLAYVIRDNEDVPAAAPPLENTQPYSTEHGSLVEEMIARASHTHALYREDNASVYYALEEATRGTSYAASIKPFQRRKDGRGAWMALTSQYAGQDKWDAELKRQDELLHTRKWKGTSTFSLDRFVAQHRNAYVSMQQCAEYVDFQLPNEFTRVGYLLDAIETSDASLQAAMALVRNDTAPGGKRNNFEAAASFLLPHDPVAKKHAATKRPHANISAIDSASIKSGVGKKTGVELRYHTKSEYRKLSKAERSELHEWRMASEKDGKGEKKSQATTKKVRFQKMVSDAVASALTARQAAETKQQAEKDDAAVGAYLLSLVQAASTDTKPPSASMTASSATVTPAPTASASTPAITLQSILKRAAKSE